MQSKSEAFKFDPAATSSFPALGTQLEKRGRHAPGDARFSAVVIGGGSGASVSARTLALCGLDTSVVVSMADDGGSTGLLRETAGVTPPGDIRKCLCALAANPDDPFVKAFKCRMNFANNHTLGNLVLATLEETAGSFPDAIKVCERLLGVVGHVLPSTLSDITLVGTLENGTRIVGQAECCHAPARLKSLEIKSSGTVEAYAPAITAIRNADIIVIGPGSFYTSLLSCLLVPGILDAVNASKAPVVFVCPACDSQGETAGMKVLDYYHALMEAGLEPARLNYFIVDTLSDEPHVDSSEEPTMDARISATTDDVVTLTMNGVTCLTGQLVDTNHPLWHEPVSLQEHFMKVIEECLSPLM